MYMDTRNSFWTKTNEIAKFVILDVKTKFVILDENGQLIAEPNAIRDRVWSGVAHESGISGSCSQSGSVITAFLIICRGI